MLQATGYSFISGSLTVVSLGQAISLKKKLIMYVGCQDHCHLKASVIFIFNIILFVSLYIFMYKFYETQA